MEKKEWIMAWGELYEGIKTTDESLDSSLKSSAEKTRKKLAKESIPTEEEYQLAKIKRVTDWHEATQEWKENAQIGKRKIGRSIGKGGQGEVFLLESTDPNASPIVLKAPTHPEPDETDSEESRQKKLGRIESAIKDLKYEAEMYEAVGPHPNIARCLGVHKVGTKEGLVMEAITGGDMSKAISDLNKKWKEGSVSDETYWGMMQFNTLRTLEALAHIEKQGYLHHDIKSPNIMIDAESGEPKLIDLGITTKTGFASRGGFSTYGHTPYDGISDRATSKADVFSVGSMLYEVLLGNTGENAKVAFDYGGTKGALINQMMVWGSKTGEDAKALKVVDHDQASTVSATCPECKKVFNPKDHEVCSGCGAKIDGSSVQWTKNKGKYSASTAYVEFVNSLLSPKPENRMSLSEALEHPFLKNRMLDDETAREQFRKLVAGRKDAPVDKKGVSFEIVVGTTATAWKTTYENAVQAGAVPDASGLATTIAECLTSVEKKKDFQSIVTAQDEGVRAIDNLLSRQEYSDNSIMKQYLETLRKDIQQPPEFDVVQGFDAVSWTKTLQNAIDAFAVPESDLIEEVSDHMEDVSLQWNAFRDLKNDWDVRNEAGRDCVLAAKEVVSSLKKFEQQPEFVKGLSGYLGKIITMARNDQEARDSEYQSFLKFGKPKTLDVGSLHTEWTTAKNAAEKQFGESLPEHESLPKGTKFAKYLPFEKNLGKALNDVVKAVAKRNDNNTRAAIKKATDIINEYFRMIISKEREWKEKKGIDEADPEFFNTLKSAIRDIMLALKNA